MSSTTLFDQESSQPLFDGTRPAWASGWGQDKYGGFVEFSLPSGDKYWDFLDQRLRWIPPGTFRMGSPNTEQGRWEDEGPQHDVTISRGFWLFNTPCTQDLWEHVMGTNPSRFKDPQRPVENVFWHDCQAFCRKLSELVPGPEFVLPSEAQWEYACRAGTDQATYAGDMKILGDCNAPILDSIAWYAGNSGVDFDLDDGEDSSAWPKKQYDHKLAGTRKVAQKVPNPWGLYDMLGNVWDWCQDGKREYRNRAEIDPLGATEAGSDRVIRGGSWYDVARYVRFAYRKCERNDFRYFHLGFRCACVQSPSETRAVTRGRGTSQA